MISSISLIKYLDLSYMYVSCACVPNITKGKLVKLLKKLIERYYLQESKTLLYIDYGKKKMVISIRIRVIFFS